VDLLSKICVPRIYCFTKITCVVGPEDLIAVVMKSSIFWERKAI
jgi:hypothetical protein